MRVDCNSLLFNVLLRDSDCCGRGAISDGLAVGSVRRTRKTLRTFRDLRALVAVATCGDPTLEGERLGLHRGGGWKAAYVVAIFNRHSVRRVGV